MAKPSKILERALVIIQRDLKRIADAGLSKDLSRDEAFRVTRYASILDSIIKNDAKDLDKQKKKLEDHTTEELIEELIEERKKNAVSKKN